MPAPTLDQSKHGAGAEPRTDEGLHLTVMGPNTFETYPLSTSSRVDIGRDDAADVRIVDELASRVHARVHVDSSGTVTVEDLASHNGSFVRGKRIAPGKRVELHAGEALTIGFTHLMVQRRQPRVSVRRLRSHGVFEERLDEACERAGERAGAGPAVIRVRFDDEAPTGAGADVLQAGLRSGDMLAQYAAGEYEILLFETDLVAARGLAEGFGARAHAAGLAPRIAVVAHPVHGRSAEALIGTASALLAEPEGDDPAAPILKSSAMREIYRVAARAAAGHTADGLITVLVLGETGTGKEVLASWIHRRSPRAEGPFLCINCAALTESLLESELFGHEKGAFTGAGAAKPGLLESAAGGTVFLDEIGEMNSALQTKLLRTLENREIIRVGGRVSRRIDVRFIAATNRDLEDEVANRRFRQDLYFRLNGISLTIPPLRERPADVSPLARRFIAQASRSAGRRPPGLSAEALELLQSYSWPGNIRELRNMMERALVLCEGGEITSQDLPVEKLRLQRVSVRPAARAADLGDDTERQRVLDAMAAVGGNQSRAAETLGIARGTLIARLERYGIKRPQAPHRRPR